jgi:hypothetical protein
VLANQRCKSGALLEIKKKGRPAATNRRPSNGQMGLMPIGGAQPVGKPREMPTMRGKRSKATCSTACRRTPSQFAVVWA